MTVTTDQLAPVYYDPALVNPSPNGLYAATSWTEVNGPSRFLAGVQLRTLNYDGAFGVWDVPWCGSPGDAATTPAREWNVTVLDDAPYTLSVDGVATTELTSASTTYQIERALNETSVEVGLTVRGSSTRYEVYTGDSGTPGVLTGTPNVQIEVVEGTALKTGERPGDPPPFDPMVVWAFDQCDLTAASQQEVRERVAQTLRLQEQTAVERSFADRLLADAGTPVLAPTFAEALGVLELGLAETNTLGFIHASPALAPLAAKDNLLVRSGAALKTPLGNTWVFGGGYGDGLGDIMVASSPTVGWRDPAVVRDTTGLPSENVYAAIAERAVVIGYERAVAAAQVGVA